jgi:rhodanese-related sulfurtransferase
MTALGRLTVDDALARARAGLDRLNPAETYDAVRRGAVLVDIRPAVNRDSEGELPGALVIDRNVLEWRLDPSSGACIPDAHPDRHVVLVCNEGYASSLAAAALQQLGLHRATDLIGGFRAWRAAGLPTTPPRARLRVNLTAP